MSRRVLVTGADGQLGREMRRVAQGGSDSYLFTDVEQLDITNFDAVIETMESAQIDLIVNCAAFTNVEGAEGNEAGAYLLNDIAVGNLARAADKFSATLIHISTDYVFDGRASQPYTEESTPSPIGVYGKSKFAGEQRIRESGCRYIIIRTSWLYSQWGKNFVKSIVQLSGERESLSVVFDQVGSPTYAGDLAEAIDVIIRSGDMDQRDIYHYSGEGVCSWYDFAQMICSQSGSRCCIKPIHSRDYGSAVERPHFSVLDSSKIKSRFGIEIPHWSHSLELCLVELKKRDRDEV